MGCCLDISSEFGFVLGFIWAGLDAWRNVTATLCWTNLAVPMARIEVRSINWTFYHLFTYDDYYYLKKFQTLNLDPRNE